MVTACELYIKDLYAVVYVGQKLAALTQGWIRVKHFNRHITKARGQADATKIRAALDWILEQAGKEEADIPGAACLVDVIRIRDCIVHRAGVVSERDAPSGSLRARWRHSYMLLDGQRVGPAPWQVAEGVEIAAALLHEDVEREWRLGEAVALGEQDGHDIALCLLALVEQLRAVTRDHLTRRFAEHNAARSASST
jgi:hypothetical protein